ncbi:MAG TPA: 16S rRNA (adenine(1518)-N(6)/adenine(1519)-N(6))-dimethyltransferase RsmA [Melioribacteraceae bacterium]|nr:16S rRNA (adenine(1518)-N(6)/adenine(1519)-N(6))-dimethyltransferase RsmA [Melioribacteraceae bacterium]
MKPLKQFGQNFLQDNNIIEKIITLFNPNATDIVVEIGPGTGALTKKLYPVVKNFYAIEIDTRAALNLTQEFPNLILFREDVLNFEFNQIYKLHYNPLRIIGNLPYNITSPIIFKVFENIEYINDMVFMVQYEVAKRFTAEKGTKDYGILSVLLNFFTETKFCFKVSRNCFYPVPNVESAIVYIKAKDLTNCNVNKKIFISTVKAAFGNRRKTLKNSFSNSIFKEFDLSKIDFDFSKRAEQLNLEDFIYLSNCFYNSLYKNKR